MAVTDYYLLDYTQSAGKAYIDLGFPPNLEDKVEIHYYFDNTETDQTIIGSSAETSRNSYGVCISYYRYYITYYEVEFGDAEKNYVSITPRPSDMSRDYVVTFDKSSVTYNGTTKSMTVATSLNITDNMYLFNDGYYYEENGFKGKIYYCNYYRNGILIRQFVPAMSVSDSTNIGMYDLVNNVYYPSITSAKFTGGAIQTGTTTLQVQGNGTVSGGGTYNKNVDGNIRHAVTATPSAGNRFVGWYFPDGSLWTTSQTAYVGWGGGTLIAKFTEDVGNVSLYVNPSGSGSTSGGGKYNYGSQVTISATPYTGFRFLNWSGGITSNQQTYTFTLSSNVNATANFEVAYNVTLNYDSQLGTASYTFVNGLTLELNAQPNSSGQFKGWFIGDQMISRNKIAQYTISGDTTFEARFTRKYAANFTFDSSLGSATLTRDSEEENIINLNVNSTITKFNGWYINNELISYENSVQYTLTKDSTVEARFEPIWTVATSTVGNGSMDYTRESSNKNRVSFTVIPNTHYHFVKYVINGEDITNPQYSLLLTRNTTAIAYFEEDTKPHISASSNIPNAYVYVSHNDDYPPYSSTIKAREYPGYTFTKWSDGSTENPRQLTVTQSVTLVAEYLKIQQTNGIYQYRCFVKDQLNMTGDPKAFMVVDSFTLRQDYLTNANSDIKVFKMNEDVSNGDVIVVYNPKGVVIYNGVITSISGNDITASQMQSFYKGAWIYNIHRSSTLEEELAWLLQQYANGNIYKSTYVDPLVAQRLSGITINSVNSTSASLPTDLDEEGNEQMTEWDMEKFIYKMYQDYNIIFDFEINMNGPNYVTIKVPTYESITIGNNHYAIKDLSPVQTIEETNRLIIYWNSDDEETGRVAKTYRTTYVATKNGIVEQPSSTANRFDLTNTKIIYSDDEIANLVASNLPNSMFNHKITFTLLLNNSLYQYEEFILGMPIEVYYNGEEYYDSILTARTIKKEPNQNVISVDYTCGLVRTALTKKLNLYNLL